MKFGYLKDKDAFAVSFPNKGYVKGRDVKDLGLIEYDKYGKISEIIITKASKRLSKKFLSKFKVI
jgi:uncharacterized protein YuzE